MIAFNRNTWCFFVLVVFSNSIWSCARNLGDFTCNGSLPVSEYFSLFDLYNSTNGELWSWKVAILGSKWRFPNNITNTFLSPSELSAPCSQQWQGLRCQTLSHDNCTIIELLLPAYNLVGVIPTSIGELSQLTNLVLSANSLTHTIPTSIGQLSLLKHLRLYSNELSGTFPTSIAKLSKLIELDLSSNSLTGSLPTVIDQMGRLQAFTLDYNLFSGQVPTEICKLVNLEFFGMQQNYLTGSLQSSFGYLVKLIGLGMNSNFLTGSIPSSIGQLSKLEYLDLFLNFFTSTLPKSLYKLSELRVLYVYNNLLSGTLAHSLGNLTQLLNLGLDLNRLTGTIPSSLGQLSKLHFLGLSVNHFHGCLPSTLGNFSELIGLYLDDNSLTGTIPSSFGGLYNVKNFYVNSNFLSSTIPSSLGQLAIVDFDLNSNRLTGFLPDSLTQIQTLVNLNLGQNALSGTVATGFSQLPVCVQFFMNGNLFDGNLLGLFSTFQAFQALELLDLSDNSFTGSFPSSVFRLPKLRTVSITSNCFSGSLNDINVTADSALTTIAIQGLSSGFGCRKFNLRSVAQLVFPQSNPGYVPDSLMTGPIPSALWSIPSLTSLSLGGNGFTGYIDIGDFNALTSNLTSVSLAYNRLTGSIPTTFQLYGRFKYLDLSYNRLSGTLQPDFTFAVSDTASLNISVNRLSGNIPTINFLSNTAADVVATILNGNLFEFEASFLKDSAQFSGSFNLNVAMACSSIIFIMTTLIIFTKRQISSTTVIWRFDRIKSLETVKWWLCSQKQFNTSGRKELKLFWSFLHMKIYFLVSISGLSLLFGFVFLVLKLVPSLNAEFSMYEVEYGWTWSSAYLRGVAPTVIMLLFAGSSVIVFYFKYGGTIKTSPTNLRSSFNTVVDKKFGSNAEVTGSILIIAPSDMEIACSPVTTNGNFDTDSTVTIGPSDMETTGSVVAKDHSDMGATCSTVTNCHSDFTYFRPGIPPQSAITFQLSYACCMFGVVLINGVVMIVAYALYVHFLDSSKITIIQISLAIFKNIWIQLMKWILTKAAKYFGDRKGTRLFRTTRLQLSIFNFIIVPCLVTAVVDPSCFYELFVQADAIPSSGNIFSCADFYFFYADGRYSFSCSSSGNSTGIESGLVAEQLSTPLDPPFIYNYQCSSALITNYVPVLLYNFLFLGGVAPAAALVVMIYPSIGRVLPSSLRNLLFGPIYMLGGEDPTLTTVPDDLKPATTLHASKSTTSDPTSSDYQSDSRCTTPLSASSDAIPSEYGCDIKCTNSMHASPQTSIPSNECEIFEPSVLLDRLDLFTVLLLTFGFSTPFLAIVIALSALLNVIFTQLLVGRYVHMCQRNGLTGDGDAHTKIGEALVGITGSFFCRFRIFFVVIVTVVFWGLLIFDTVGDVAGSQQALKVMIAWMSVTPLLVYWIVRGLHSLPW